MNRICIFINSLENSGGTERVSSILANTLVDLNYEVSIVTIKKTEQIFFPLDPRVHIEHLEQNITISPLFYRFNIIKNLRRFLLKNKINSIVTVDSLLCIYSLPAVIFNKIKHICWEQFSFKIDLGIKTRLIARQLAGLLSDHIIVLSKKDEEFWKKGLLFNFSSVHVIHNPSPFSVSDKYYDISSKNVLAVGRLSYEKGFDLLLRAWSIVCEKNPEWTLTIVGSGVEKRELEKLAQDLDIHRTVIFAGATDNIATFYNRSSIFCLSSRHEGFGLVLVEAMSFGMPSVAFDCDCGPSELLNADNGLLIKSGDVDSFAKAINFLIDNDNIRQRMSANSKLKANDFTILNFSKNWDSILNIKRK